MFADDMQIYTVYKGKQSELTQFKNCLKDIKVWSAQNYLKLNDTKTKFLMITSDKPRISAVDFDFNLMETKTILENQVKNLGVIIDQKLSLKSQINKVCKFGFYMLKNLWRISSKINDITIKIQLVHSCILSHLDYCNSLYVDLPKKEIKKLQRVMNASVRFIYNLRRTAEIIHITPYLKKCHFLPINLRIKFKICVLVYTCIQGIAPVYLRDLLKPKDSLESLRVHDDNTLLHIPSLSKMNYKNRKFSTVAPRLWNQLPQELRQCESLQQFKSKLKTFYFDQFLLCQGLSGLAAPYISCQLLGPLTCSGAVILPTTFSAKHSLCYFSSFHAGCNH